MAAYAIGQGLLGEAALFAQGCQTLMEIARGIGAGYKCAMNRRRLE